MLHTPFYTHESSIRNYDDMTYPKKKLLMFWKTWNIIEFFWGTFNNKQLGHNSSFRWITYLCQGPNHNITSSSIYYEMIIHIIRTLNTINMWINGISSHWCNHWNCIIMAAFQHASQLSWNLNLIVKGFIFVLPKKYELVIFQDKHFDIFCIIFCTMPLMPMFILCL